MFLVVVELKIAVFISLAQQIFNQIQFTIKVDNKDSKANPMREVRKKNQDDKSSKKLDDEGESGGGGRGTSSKSPHQQKSEK